tara:strand:- start:136 stop:288 length:153 start_codon:yes stop_codon:yes gene_type:complete
MNFTWKATIRTKWGDMDVTIQAPNQHIAKKLIESKYGAGTILGNYVGRVD